MTGDEGIREAERAVGEDPHDVDARHALTKKRLASASGIVAWWRGATRPHLSAAKTVLRYESEDQWGRKHTSDAKGWAVAVADLEDAFDLSYAARSASLIDLSTGRWAKLQGVRSSPGVLTARQELTTVDAWGRPRETERRQARVPAIDMPQGAVATGSPYPESSGSTSNIAGRWRDQPIYDTEFWDPSHRPSMLSFFQNFLAFASLYARGGGVKMFGLDCNLYGNGGSLPLGHLFDGTGISITFLTPERKPMRRDVAMEIAEQAYVELRRLHTQVATWPCADLLTSSEEDHDPGSPDSVLHLPPPPVFPFAWPFSLEALETFGVEVRFPRQPREAGSGFFVRVELSGFMVRALAG